ncbi:pyridoxal phosphate-dependent decarboxylase family protein [Paracoccus pacificus]|uniref:Pyridoxal phosphate-dependent decarboxylase family protein n=1 Tax=Paracoccus pacificus TaxID=1463598 RepID=A0ABW4RDL8_9RHOB
MSALEFELNALPGIGADLLREITRIYESSVPMPTAVHAIPSVPKVGRGMARLPELWALIVDSSSRLASPWMSGHMDTAPHPAAALTQAVVAALNNNLLFRELSPFASDIEEHLIAHFTRALGLGNDWTGLFASGGSIAGLTALFAAVGGYAGAGEGRDRFRLLMPESAHVSLRKAAIVLGMIERQIQRIDCDDAGRLDPAALEQSLRQLPGGARPIVVSVLGTTIHGSVDDIAAVAALCARYGAWHHVDAIHGGALAYSHHHRHFLSGLDQADSITLGPQKWMYVPRVSAICLLRGQQRLDDALGLPLPYSIGERPHRGRWGLQGSRPADAVVLWAILQTLGTDALGSIIDRLIGLTTKFHELLTESQTLVPTHKPDLNLQVFRIGKADRSGDRLAAIQERLAAAGATWMSISRWRDEVLMRAVLLSPSLTEAHLRQFVRDIEKAADQTA